MICKKCLGLVLLLGNTLFAHAEFSDPTAPLKKRVDYKAKEKEQKENLVLASIIVGPRSKIAIINGRRYRESDQVGEFNLINIGTKTVTLRKGQEQLFLRVLSSYAKEF